MTSEVAWKEQAAWRGRFPRSFKREASSGKEGAWGRRVSTGKPQRKDPLERKLIKSVAAECNTPCCATAGPRSPCRGRGGSCHLAWCFSGLSRCVEARKGSSLTRGRCSATTTAQQQQLRQQQHFDGNSVAHAAWPARLLRRSMRWMKNSLNKTCNRVQSPQQHPRSTHLLHCCCCKQPWRPPR